MNSYPQKPVVDRPKNVSYGGSSVSRFLAISLVLACMSLLSWTAQAAWERGHIVAPPRELPEWLF